MLWPWLCGTVQNPKGRAISPCLQSTSYSQANCSCNCTHLHVHSWTAMQANNYISLNVGFSWHAVFISISYINIFCKEKLLNSLSEIPSTSLSSTVVTSIIPHQVHRDGGTLFVGLFLPDRSDTKLCPYSEFLARKLFLFFQMFVSFCCLYLSWHLC